MASQLYDDFQKNPLLQTKTLDGVLTYFYVAASSNVLGQYMPLVNVDSDKVTMDIDKAQGGGMTPGVAQGAESPIYHAPDGRGQKEWTPAEFREKVRVMEDELIDLRKLGTLGDLVGQKELLQKKYRKIEERLANRLEWMRRQVLFDSEVSYDIANTGIKQTVAYSHPSYLDVTAGILWDNASADPLDDLQSWAYNYELETGFKVKQVLLPSGTLNLLTQNDRFREIATANWGAFKATPQQVNETLQLFLGVGMVEESRHRINFLTEMSADAAAAQAVINLQDASELEAGDTIFIRSMSNENSEKAEVASVSGNQVTLTANLTNAFNHGDPVRYAKFIIPSDKVLIIGEPMTPVDIKHQESLSAEYLNPFADVASCYSRYETLEPKAGVFTKLRDFIDIGDPPHVEQILGIRALPRVHYQDGWMTAKIK